jgi:hypothetical protein
MRAGYFIVAVICLSPCIVASLNAISKIGGNRLLIPVGMIIVVVSIMAGIIILTSGELKT